MGNLVGGYSGGRFGPKKTIVGSSIPGALGWILIATSPNPATLILGRLLTGVAGGLISPNCSPLVVQYRLD